MLEALVSRIEALAKKVADTPVFAWATVTSIDPLQITIGGDEKPLEITPAAIYCPADVGERVLVLQVYRRCIILGSAGHPKARWGSAVAPKGWIPITGGREVPLKVEKVVGMRFVPNNSGTFLITDPGLYLVTGQCYFSGEPVQVNAEVVKYADSGKQGLVAVGDVKPVTHDVWYSTATRIVELKTGDRIGLVATSTTDRTKAYSYEDHRSPRIYIAKIGG